MQRIVTKLGQLSIRAAVIRPQKALHTNQMKSYSVGLSNCNFNVAKSIAGLNRNNATQTRSFANHKYEINASFSNLKLIVESSSYKA